MVVIEVEVKKRGGRKQVVEGRERKIRKKGEGEKTRSRVVSEKKLSLDRSPCLFRSLALARPSPVPLS